MAYCKFTLQEIVEKFELKIKREIIFDAVKPIEISAFFERKSISWLCNCFAKW